jgi:adenylyltransferase/sulfurtransferase
MIQYIRPEELAVKLNGGESIYLLDVRQPEEYAYCHLADSLLIPLPELTARLDEVSPPEGALVVVYCHHGIRSLSGAAIIQQAGHERVASLSGGIDAWSMRIDPSIPRY